MSLLLDALRKAEEERRLGQPPTLAAVTRLAAASAVADRRWLPWLLGGGGLALGLAALALLLLRPPRAAPAPAPVPAVTTAPAPVVRAPPLEALPLPPEEGVYELSDLEIEPALRSTPPVAVAPAPRAAPEPPPRPLDSPPQPGPALNVERIQLAAAGDVAVPLAEMPAEYRASFPAFRVDVHVWNEDPAQRFVRLNGRRYREGDVTQEGPRLLAIVMNGMDFEHRGTRVRLPLGG